MTICDGMTKAFTYAESTEMVAMGRFERWMSGLGSVVGVVAVGAVVFEADGEAEEADGEEETAPHHPTRRLPLTLQVRPPTLWAVARLQTGSELVRGWMKGEGRERGRVGGRGGRRRGRRRVG